MKIVHGAIGGIVVLALNYAIATIEHHNTPTAPSTITVSIYHGRSGNSGFEGVATCHSVSSSAHGAVVKYHRCSPIRH